MSDSCQLCTNPGALGEIIYQDDVAGVLLHPDSAVAGHAMVVAGRHVQNVSDLTVSEQARFITVHGAAEKALLEVTGRERAILLKLGIQVPHLHLHIYPVGASLDRRAVMEIIDARTEEPRAADFSTRVRHRLTALLA